MIIIMLYSITLGIFLICACLSNSCVTVYSFKNFYSYLLVQCMEPPIVDSTNKDIV